MELIRNSGLLKGLEIYMESVAQWVACRI